MSHVRQQIRDRAETVLTGLTTTGDNVFASRIYPFQEDDTDLPGLCIYTESEEVRNDDEDTVSGVQVRSMLLVVEGYSILTTGLDDKLDTIAAEVETAIFADQYFNSLAHGTDLVGIETDISADAEKPVGVVRLIFRVYYLTTEGAPETAL